MKKIKQTFVVLTILGFVFLHFYAPRIITEIKNPLVNLIKGSYKTTTNPTFDNNQTNGKYITFKSFDDIELSSYLTYSSLSTVKGTIILLHGIRSNKESFIKLSAKLSEHGYNSIALDSRAHGNSNGTHCTFGVNEKKDVSELINVLSEREKIIENIGVWGQSLGGAIGLQALGSDKRIKFGIIESTFSDFKTITNDYFNYHVGFNIKPLTNYLVYRAGKIAEFDSADAKPIKYCENIEQPILIIHGNEDKRINIKYAKENFAKIESKEKEFIEIEGANHLNVWKIGGEEYFERIVKFIAKNTIDKKKIKEDIVEGKLLNNQSVGMNTKLNRATIESVFGYRFSIEGDFNGDKKQDTLNEHFYSSITNIETNKFYTNINYEELVELTINKKPISFLLSNTNEIDTFFISKNKQLLGLSFLKNEGDLNEDGTDEISYVINYADWSNMNTWHIVTYKNNEWTELYSFSIRDMDFVGLENKFINNKNDSINSKKEQLFLEFNGLVKKIKKNYIQIIFINDEVMIDTLIIVDLNTVK